MKPLPADLSRPWRQGAVSASGSRRRSIRTERLRYSEYGGAGQAELSRLLRAGWKATLPDRRRSPPPEQEEGPT